MTDVDKLRRALADHPLTQIARALMPRTAAIVDRVVETAAPVAAEAAISQLNAVDAQLEAKIVALLTGGKNG